MRCEVNCTKNAPCDSAFGKGCHKYASKQLPVAKCFLLLLIAIVEKFFIISFTSMQEMCLTIVLIKTSCKLLSVLAQNGNTDGD